MSKYQSDRIFTDYIFNNLAKKIIYPQLNWKEIQIDEEELEKLDINNGIDTIIENENNEILGVQYRFRDGFYSSYNDFTFRYKREYNQNKERVMSEFFKIEAKYFLYGISNGKKFEDKLYTNTKFLKWAIIDVDNLLNAIDNGLIVIDEKLYSITCQLRNGKMFCPVNNNKDNSSSFVPFDIPILNKISNDIVVASSGF
ncbi:hypothetical protein ROV67_07500 [Pasteurella multocida]|uniref:hypothetical protein n=1 Tax=Pasteurella multocida TaxID=747 RepID=UPI000CE867CA|nr:hypothetical protein [Pasteurella multocida]MEB3482737.1 hypothetical protein [Pasteurella multocida]PPE94573.1 hypothetical protein CBE90_06485 [Pasteurella multocida]PPE95443.1 hypothetical protein CBE91_09140 [Pasteurella multocida]HDR1061150.1 hypothetical protein [Pasteurella multocida]